MDKDYVLNQSELPHVSAPVHQRGTSSNPQVRVISKSQRMLGEFEETLQIAYDNGYRLESYQVAPMESYVDTIHTAIVVKA